jgi:hypothetical protein
MSFLAGKMGDMFRYATRPSGLTMLLFGLVLLAAPGSTFAQHGGGTAVGSGTSAGGAGAPSGVSEKDDLKNFHRAMEVQATDDQRAAFASIAKDLQDASDRLQLLQKAPASVSLPPEIETAAAVNHDLEKARTATRNFLASFSPAQKSALKEIIRKLEKADSDLDRESRSFDQLIQVAKPPAEQIAGSAAPLLRALTGFQSEQLSLGREMSILLLPADGQELAFTLPRVTNSLHLADQTVSIPTSATVARLSSAAGDNAHHLYRLQQTVDLSDLQQNFNLILRYQLTRSPRCGERVEIQQASLAPLAPASLAVVTLHYERWICPTGAGRASPVEVADGDGEIEIKLTPALDRNGLILNSEITRVVAQGALRQLLTSGDLGDALRHQIATSFLGAVQKSADPNATLPPVAQNSTTLQKAEFQDAGANQLILVLDGQLQLSDDQSAQFSQQLTQRLSAQAPPSH